MVSQICLGLASRTALPHACVFISLWCSLLCDPSLERPPLGQQSVFSDVGTEASVTQSACGSMEMLSGCHMASRHLLLLTCSNLHKIAGSNSLKLGFKLVNPFPETDQVLECSLRTQNS